MRFLSVSTSIPRGKFLDLPNIVVRDGSITSIPVREKDHGAYKKKLLYLHFS